MALVFVAVAQQFAMELLDVVLGDGDLGPGGEDRLHNIRVAGHFLLVAGSERLDLEVGERRLDLAVGEPSALDAGRGADTLDGRDPAECGEPLRRQGAEGSPGALELVDLRDEGEHLGGDAKRG
jgi:hypothetical protein